MNDHHDPTRSSGSPDPLTGEPGATLFDWPRQAGMTDTVLHAMAVTLTRRRRRHRLLGAATGVGIALLVGTTWQLRREQLPGGNAASTAIVSAPVRQMLEDGSLLELKEGAQISVDFTGALRRVILNRGEAHFDVAKDPTRDFVVQAGAVDVRAVGTAFAIGVGEASIEVLVTEGRVAIEPNPSTAAASAAKLPPIAPALVAAGHHLVVGPGTPEQFPAPTALSDAEISDRLTWRIPRLQFSGTLLADAISMVNKYSPVQLVLADARLGKVRLSGMIRADNIELLLALLEADYGIIAERRGDDTVALRKSR